MSRVHDALRRAELAAGSQPNAGRDPGAGARDPQKGLTVPEPSPMEITLLDQVEEIAFSPAPESHLLRLDSPQETPSEEFRSLRTKLNHMQTLQDIHTVIVTSPSPAEGKSFCAVNLALAQAHMAENLTLLVDLDLRRPVMHNLFQLERSPGMTDYLQGREPLHRVMKKVAGTNLFVIPAGSAVRNPLELLNLKEVRVLFSQLPTLFNWIIMDTPPILFSADSNLLSTIADGTVLVVRIGETTIDSVTRAMQALCENNVLGIVANGARAAELYYKYTYYYSRDEEEEVVEEEPEEEAPAATSVRGREADPVLPKKDQARLKARQEKSEKGEKRRRKVVVEDEKPAPKPAKTAPVAKALLPSPGSDAEVEDEAEPAVEEAQPPRSAAAPPVQKARPAAKPAPEDDDDDEDVEEEEAEEAPKKKRGWFGRSAKPAAKPAPEDDDDEDVDEEAEEGPKEKRGWFGRSAKPAAKPAPDDDDEDDVEEEAEEAPRKKTGWFGRSTKPAANAASEDDDEDDVEEEASSPKQGNGSYAPKAKAEAAPGIEPDEDDDEDDDDRPRARAGTKKKWPWSK